MLYLALGLCVYAGLILCVCALVGANGDDDDEYAPHRPIWQAPTVRVHILDEWKQGR